MEGSSSLTSFIKVASSVSTRVLPPGGHFELGAYYKNAVFMREICCVAEKNVCECVCVALLIFHCIRLLATGGLFWSRPCILSTSVLLLSWVFEVGSQNIWSDLFKRCTYFKNYCLHFQHTISASGRKLMRVLRQGRSHWNPIFQWAVSGGYGNGEVKDFVVSRTQDIFAHLLWNRAEEFSYHEAVFFFLFTFYWNIVDL